MNMQVNSCVFLHSELNANTFIMVFTLSLRIRKIVRSSKETFIPFDWAHFLHYYSGYYNVLQTFRSTFSYKQRTTHSKIYSCIMVEPV